MVVNVIRIGEKTGTLTESLYRLNVYFKWRQDFRQHLFKALIYPCLLSVVVIGLIIVLMMVVMPQLHSFLITTQHDLPWSTKILIMVVQAFEQHGLKIVTGWGITIMIFITAKKISSGFCGWIDRLKLRLPIIGPMLALIDTERFIYTLHILITTGMPLLKSLRQATIIIKNTWIVQGLVAIHRRIEGGELLSSALENEKIFSYILPHLIVAGEKSGNLPSALGHCHDYLKQSVKQRLDLIISLIEPSLILILGSILVWIAVAIFNPIYDQLTEII